MSTRIPRGLLGTSDLPPEPLQWTFCSSMANPVRRGSALVATGSLDLLTFAAPTPARACVAASTSLGRQTSLPG